ncbi:MAG: DUF3822 family protein [Bacteroidota bacterium]
MANTISSKSYQPLLAVKDRSFNTAALSQYHLSIHVHDTSFKISCVNPITTQCLFLETYNLPDGTMQQQVDAIATIYEDNLLLGAGDWSTVTLCNGSQQYTLIPQDFFQETTAADYLKFACPIGTNTVRYFTHSSINLAVAFAVEPLLLNWFEKTYEHTQLQTIHQASSLIEATLTYLQGENASLLPQIIVFVGPNHLHIVIVQKDKLLYYNRFVYTSSDEFLYYILSVMSALQLDPSFHEVILAGSIGKGSVAYRKARRYIRKLSIIDKPPYLKGRRAFSRSILVTHLDVLSTHLCS